MTAQAYTVGWNGDWSPSKFHPLAQGRIVFHLDLTADRITNLDYSLGFNHRADEKVLEVRDFRQGLSLINRPNWLIPIAAEIAYAQTAEELMGLKPPARAMQLRALVLALQNLLSAHRFAAGVLDSLGLSPLAHLQYAERLAAWQERLTGARLHDAFVRLGGVAADIENSLLIELRDHLTANEVPELVEVEVHPVAATRLEVLPVALNPSTLLQTIETALQTESPYFVQLPKVVKVPRGQSFKKVSNWNGEFGVWHFSDGGKSPARIHLRAASLETFTQLKRDCLGLTLTEFQQVLIASPISIGEIER